MAACNGYVNMPLDIDQGPGPLLFPGRSPAPRFNHPREPTYFANRGLDALMNRLNLSSDKS